MSLNPNKKIMVSGVIFGIVIFIFIVLIIYPLFGAIRAESKELISQKNKQAELILKTENIKEFQKNYKDYQPNLKRIDNLFVNSAEPINFIEFLEREAANSRLSIEIAPFPPPKIKEDLWSSMNFQLKISGAFSDFLKFLEKLESSPYLIEVLNLNINKPTEEELVSNLLIKVYVRDNPQKD
jgi:Tfp pilus assembly protein PilO